MLKKVKCMLLFLLLLLILAGCAGDAPNEVDDVTITETRWHAPELSGIEIVDARTFRFHLSSVDAPSLTHIATWGISPKHIFEGTPVAELDRRAAITHPIGAGPFRFVRYVEGQFIEMEANENFHRGRPELDRIIVRVASADVAQAELVTGGVDIALVQPDKDDFALFEDHGLEINQMPSNAYQYMGMQMNHPILGDKRVRHAITYALDRQAMVSGLFDGMAVQQVSHMSSVSWAFDPDAEPFPFDPIRAAALLDEAGWALDDSGVRFKDGEPLELTLIYPSGNVPRERSAEIIQSMLGNVGIKIVLEMKEVGTLATQVFEKQDFDLYLLGWELALEPDPSGIWLSTDPWNAVNFVNTESDELILKGRAVLDQDERARIYSTWQHVLLEEAPYVWLYAEKEAWVSNPRVENFRPDSFGVYWDVWNWATDDGRAVIAIWSAPEGLFNPNLSQSAYDNYSYAPVFAGLMRFDPDDDYRLIPELAESMEISEDNLTVTFVLRDDIYFHDGTKVTAEDVKWTFEWMCHPDYTGVRASMWMFIVGFDEFHYGITEEKPGFWPRETAIVSEQ